jgi:hypothetical protein
MERLGEQTLQQHPAATRSSVLLIVLCSLRHVNMVQFVLYLI